MRAEVRVAFRLDANASIGFAAERDSMRVHAETGRTRFAASVAGYGSIAMSARFRIGSVLHAGPGPRTPTSVQDSSRRSRLLPRRIRPRGETCDRELTWATSYFSFRSSP